MNRISLLLLAGLAAAGCQRKLAPTQSAATTNPTTTAAPAPKPAAPAGVKAVNTTFTALNGRGKIRVKLPNTEQSANFNLRLRRDSAIWLSGGLLGIEGVRALLTPDSVRVLNRLEKTYFAGSYAYLGQVLGVPVSFGQMQAILLGDYLPPADASTQPTIQTDATGQRVSYPVAALVLEQLVGAANGRVQQVRVSQPGTPRTLTVQHSDFQTPTGATVPFAFTTNLTGQQQAGTPAVEATLNYNRVEVGNARLEFPFSVPKGYRRQTRVGK